MSVIQYSCVLECSAHFSTRSSHFSESNNRKFYVHPFIYVWRRNFRRHTRCGRTYYHQHVFPNHFFFFPLFLLFLHVQTPETETITKKRMTSNETDETCAVCYGDEERWPPWCLQRWLTQEQKCPYCRKSMQPTRLQPVTCRWIVERTFYDVLQPLLMWHVFLSVFMILGQLVVAHYADDPVNIEWSEVLFWRPLYVYAATPFACILTSLLVSTDEMWRYAFLAMLPGLSLINSMGFISQHVQIVLGSIHWSVCLVFWSREVYNEYLKHAQCILLPRPISGRVQSLDNRSLMSVLVRPSSWSL